MERVTTAYACSQTPYRKPYCGWYSPLILNTEVQSREATLPCSNPLSGSRYLVIPACKTLFSRNNCKLFCFCRKQGCLWISRHYLPQAKSAFTSRVQRLLFIYFIKAFVPVSKYSKSENYETSLVSQMSVYHQQSGQQAIAKLCFLEKITAQKIFSDA